MTETPAILLDQSFPCELQSLVDDRYTVNYLEDAFKLEEEERARFTGFLVYMHPLVDEALLDRFPGLRVVANFGAGYNHIDVAKCGERGVHVSNTPGATNSLSRRAVFHGQCCPLAPLRRSCERGYRGPRNGACAGVRTQPD